MNKVKVAEGLSYNFHFSEVRPSTELAEKLIKIKDTVRDLGLLITCNEYGQIVIQCRETNKERARTFHV